LSDSRLAANRSDPVDNQIRQTQFRHTGIDDARLVLLCDRRKLSSAPSRPAIFTQERSKVFPCFAFAPSVAQGPGPAASGLDVCGRGRVDDHPDGVGAILLAKPEQLGNASSRRFCLILSSQTTVELKRGSEIVVEREPASCSKAFPLQPSPREDQCSLCSLLSVLLRRSIRLARARKCAASFMHASLTSLTELWRAAKRHSWASSR
jgi:hypothetical protein